MANTGIFITKPGVSLPVVTDISKSTWESYASNLVLAMRQSTTHSFRPFEAFRLRAFTTPDDLGTDATVNALFNAADNRALQFFVGAGSSPQVAGNTTISSGPAEFEPLNRYFLQGSNLIMDNDADMNLKARVASIDNASFILFDYDTGDWEFEADGVPDDSGNYAGMAGTTEVEIAITEAAIIVRDNDAPATIYSHARQYRAVRVTGTSVTIGSGDNVTGDWTDFDTDEDIIAGAADGNSTVRIESQFGQKTVYTVKVGTALVPSGDPNDFLVPFAAGSPSVHDVKDNFTGGVGNITYSVLSGTLPTGMVLTSNGLVQGTPSVDGTYPVQIQIQDEYGDTETLSYTFTITESANVAYLPPAGVVGTPYLYTPTISGLVGVTLSSGVLPTGLSLDTNTGELTGTPSGAGTFNFVVDIETTGGLTEQIDVEITIYTAMTAELVVDGGAPISVSNLSTHTVNQNDVIQLDLDGGSGTRQFSISGENLISSNGVISLFGSGEVTVTVIDLITGQTITFTLLVQGQDSICGMAVEEEGGDTSTKAPCVDVITDCNSPVQIAFNSMHLLRGVATGETPYREYPSFDFTEGADVQNNGKAFVMFRSTANGGYGIAKNARDGKPFILEFVVDASLKNNVNDFAVGIAKSGANATFEQLDFAMVITTVGPDRVVEIRKDNVYQAGSRFAINEGQQIGFAVFGDAIYLYIDGILTYQLTSSTFACSGMDIVFIAESANMLIGGKAGNLVYAIDTAGTIEQVGQVDAQTGLYTPSLQNVGFIRISATSTVNNEVKYVAKVRVIKPASKASWEGALIEGVPVDVYICDAERADDLPLRLDRNGRPDANQVSNPEHVGTLQGAGRVEVTPTRTEFRNDIGATSSSLTLDKVIFTGAMLRVRDFAILKKLVPYMREFNSNGVRTLKQFSTGCHKKKRLIMVWQSPDCEDVPVFDAIEIHNALSYTTFNFEVGKSVQSNIPMTIEGFPTVDGVLFDYNQYDKHFHRIGQ